jgi:hypothetical protein
MKKILFFALLFSIHNIIQAQWRNNNWIFGDFTTGSDTSISGVMRLDFTSGSPVVYKLPQINYIESFAMSVICDTIGEIEYYTNGFQINNKWHEIIENGKNLLNNNNSVSASSVRQGAMFLPYPNHPDSVVLLNSDVFIFYTTNGEIEVGSRTINYSVIDKLTNSGHGKVVERESSIIVDTLILGQLQAVKHANGRDWWIITNEFGLNNYYRFLLTPNGIVDFGTQWLPTLVFTQYGQSCFSPDGNWYIKYSSPYLSKPCWLDIYRFDRCLGLLSDHQHIKIQETGNFGGCGISANSRFAYVSVRDSILQYDLWASDIATSMQVVALYDGFLDNVQPDTTLPPFYIPTDFNMLQLGPDKKMYISVRANSSHYLHVIDQPDSLGMACDVLQHHIKLPYIRSYDLPNIPNYYLGKLPGSDCDTITVGTYDNNLSGNPSDISIFPNPATESVTVSWNIPKNFDNIKIYSFIGKLMLHQKIIGNQFNFDVSSFEEGIYFIEASGKNRAHVIKKLIVMKN